MTDKPTWTEDQIATINDRFWQGQEVPCPCCGVELKILLSQRTVYPKYMRAICRGCGANASFDSAPGRGEDFDTETAREIIELHLRGSHSACPHDGTLLTVKYHSVLGDDPGSYSIRCARCGAAAQVTWTGT